MMDHTGTLPFVPARLPVRLASLYVGLSISKFYELVSAGRIPKPLRIDGSVGWLKDDLDSFLDNLPRESEPANDGWAGQSL